ncbi:MAG: Flp1 family type IVb pilin [Firmicutes bacterium]|nr:Flp1 family type IVb pilin [Bacillota bacterium]
MRELKRLRRAIANKRGMEMVQVAILVAIAVAIGIIFKTQITAFVNAVFSNLDASNF